MAEMRKLTSYFAQFDGTGKPWSEVEPYFADLFHKDCAIITVTKDGSGTTSYDEWSEFLQQSLVKKAAIDMIKLEKVADGIEYTASLIYPGRDPIVFSSLGTFQDGQMIKVSPLSK